MTDRSDTITVYWRPGCPFCSMLRSGLHRSGVPFREVNIWNDPAAAAFVRSVARGSETVPTVTVGTFTVVNPTTRQVIELAEAESPGLVPQPTTRPGWRTRLGGRHRRR